MDINERLELACEEGNLEQVKEAIEKGADPSFDFHVPLIRACENNHVEVVKHLLSILEVDEDDMFEIVISCSVNKSYDAFRALYSNDKFKAHIDSKLESSYVEFKDQLPKEEVEVKEEIIAENVVANDEESYKEFKITKKNAMQFVKTINNILFGNRIAVCIGTIDYNESTIDTPGPINFNIVRPYYAQKYKNMVLMTESHNHTTIELQYNSTIKIYKSGIVLDKVKFDDGNIYDKTIDVIDEITYKTHIVSQFNIRYWFDKFSNITKNKNLEVYVSRKVYKFNGHTVLEKPIQCTKVTVDMNKNYEYYGDAFQIDCGLEDNLYFPLMSIGLKSTIYDYEDYFVIDSGVQNEWIAIRVCD